MITSSLRMIFWGALICIIDITFIEKSNGTGFKIDLLDDTVGAVLIAWGVFRLAKIDVDGLYSRAMKFAKIIAVLHIFDTLLDHFIFQTPEFFSFLLQIYSVACLIAIVLFCMAMQWLCRVTIMSGAERSWRFTTALFIFVYLIPLGLFYCASMFAVATGSSFNINLGPLGLLLLPVFLLPVIHLFISTSRMIKSANQFHSQETSIRI
jgi:hypothetical protein